MLGFTVMPFTPTYNSKTLNTLTGTLLVSNHNLRKYFEVMSGGKREKRVVSQKRRFRCA